MNNTIKYPDKPERTVLQNGYVIIRYIGHPNADKWGWMLEHRLIMEIKLGRSLTSNDHVHHIDEVRSNNHPDNLILESPATHMKHHGDSRRQHARFAKYNYKGVSKRKNRPSPWSATLMAFGIKHQSKNFKTQIEAAHAYDELVKKYLPDGKLNFPDEDSALSSITTTNENEED